jgi:hypothetical protein
MGDLIPADPSSPAAGDAPGAPLPWLALACAAVAAFGSVWLTVGMSLKACTLCFYQRTFAFSLLAVLALGLIGRGFRPGRASLVALPLALAGLAVAAFHTSLEFRGILECPTGMFGLGSAPQQSLSVFGVITVLLVLDLVQSWSRGLVNAATVLLALVLAGGMGWASCRTNPPLPDAPREPYKVEKPDICRPPYRAPVS